MSLIFLSVLFIVMVSLRFMTTWPLIQREISDSVYTFSVNQGFLLYFETYFCLKFLKRSRQTLTMGVLHCRVAGDADIRNCVADLLWIDNVCFVRAETWVVATVVLLYGSGHVRLIVLIRWLLGQVRKIFLKVIINLYFQAPSHQMSISPLPYYRLALSHWLSSAGILSMLTTCPLMSSPFATSAGTRISMSYFR